MNRYQRGKIYKLYNLSNHEDFYVGSTCKSQLSMRLSQHRYDATHNRTSLVYQHMKQVGIDNFIIELLESYPCNSKDELRAREGYYIRLLKPSLNQKVEDRSRLEHYQDNRASILQYQHQYYEKNKESVKRRIRERAQSIRPQIRAQQNAVKQCACGISFTVSNKARHFRSPNHKNYVLFNDSFDGLNLIEL